MMKGAELIKNTNLRLNNHLKYAVYGALILDCRRTFPAEIKKGNLCKNTTLDLRVRTI